MAGMSDSEYAKIVEELKQSKAHFPGRIGEEWQRIGRVNTLSFVDHIRSKVFHKNNYETPRGAYDKTLARDEALNQRCNALSLWQFIQELQDVSHRVAMRLWKVDDSGDSCDRGLAELDAAMSKAERSPK